MADAQHGQDELRAALRVLGEAHHASLDTVNLVPSENRLSPSAAAPLSTDFYHRYFFNDAQDPTFWQFRGGQPVGRLETDLALPALRRLAEAEHVNLRPISGMSAMLVAMGALGGRPGNTVVSIDPAAGGHYATTSVAQRLGFTACTVGVRRGTVDEDDLRAVLRRHRPALVYLDLQNSLYALDIAAVATIIRQESPATRLHVDCSHTLGLVLGRALDNPLDLGADSMGGSTHKSFPGPHKGVLFTRSDEVRDRLRETQFCLLSSHHFAETIALGLAAAEFEMFGHDYAAQIVTNAQLLGSELLAAGFAVVHDGPHVTDTHQLWLRVGDADRTDTFAERLYQAGVRVNVQVDLPGLPGPAVRVGVNEFTFDGARQWHTEQLAQVFALARDGETAAAATLRRAVKAELTEPFYLPPW
ncbi:hypothetical protein ACLQ26_27760 [Micromonospora sp. DT43]|uniref:hypothetical protein n=1 Tax=Micromonospora sp. DT43 TaxID=3393440 RepID=UPI003CF3B1CD